MIKNTMGMSLAVMALLGYVSAIDLQRKYSIPDRSLVQLSRNEDNEMDVDDFMTASIKEAEKEYEQKQSGVSPTQALSSIAGTDESTDDTDAATARKINAMTEDMILGALATRSNISYDGQNLDIDNIDLNAQAKEIQKNNKLAVKEALKELDPPKEEKKTLDKKPEEKKEEAKSLAQGKSESKKNKKESSGSESSSGSDSSSDSESESESESEEKDDKKKDDKKKASLEKKKAEPAKKPEKEQAVATKTENVQS